MNKKSYYGAFGGQYVAESLMNTLKELDDAFEKYTKDEEFLKEVDYYLKQYVLSLIHICILTGESVKPGRIFKLKCISEKVFTAMKRDLSLMISGRSFYDDLYYFKIP